MTYIANLYTHLAGARAKTMAYAFCQTIVYYWIYYYETFYLNFLKRTYDRNDSKRQAIFQPKQILDAPCIRWKIIRDNMVLIDSMESFLYILSSRGKIKYQQLPCGQFLQRFEISPFDIIKNCPLG